MNFREIIALSMMLIPPSGYATQIVMQEPVRAPAHKDTMPSNGSLLVNHKLTRTRMNRKQRRSYK